MSKEKATYSLRVRTYPQGPHTRFVSVWLIRTTGAGSSESPRVSSALLWGELIPEALRELMAATGLPYEEEHSPHSLPPLTPPECVPVMQQLSLFEE